MARIKLFTIFAGPSGIAHPGQIISVSDEAADELVSGGYAELVDEQPVRESAQLKTPEKAVLPEAGSKRPGK